jgi:NAD(P)-dependent dehydrogenase (short-subunit alcohol dehydrogenase family)
MGRRRLSYPVTKHAGVGFAEWLVINHGRDGIGVSCLCPTAVATPHFLASQAAAGGGDAGIMRNIGLLQTPEEVADAAIEGRPGNASSSCLIPGWARRSCTRPRTTTGGSPAPATGWRD